MTLEAKSPITTVGFAHICINVDNLDDATTLYGKVFNAIPIQHFPHSKDQFWAKNVGFYKNPEQVDVSVRFLLIPTVNLYIELWQYHQPKSKKAPLKSVSQIGLAHISLTVLNIDTAFQHIKACKELKLCCPLEDYKPLKVANITEDDFYFFDEKLESSKIEKSKAASLINTLRFFTFQDPYGITWELEENGCNLYIHFFSNDRHK